MSDTYRNKTLPEQLDVERFVEIFERLEIKPNSRVERVLELLSRLGKDGSQAEHITELRKALSDYRWVFQVSPTKQGLRGILMPDSEAVRSAEDRWEYGAVRDLLALVSVGGGLKRLRRCAYSECKRWIYAKRGHQQFCQGTFCRQKHYLTDPKSYEKHKASVREYDAREREYSRRAKEQARRARSR